VIAVTTTALAPAPEQRPIVGAGGVRTLTPVGTRPGQAVQPNAQGAKSIEALLQAAEASSQQRIRTKAARLREAVIELSGLIELETEAKAIEARMQKLRDELAAAETALRTLRHPSTTPATSSTSSTEVSQAVRAWAKANNIEVSPHGKVPASMVQRWRDATGRTA
jgi:hypothetical protein